jgi:orotidine-5'-phosphate decarboxylase
MPADEQGDQHAPARRAAPGPESAGARIVGATGARVEDDVRLRLALALDVDDLVAALRLARALAPWFGVAKVGAELYAAAGPETVFALVAEGYRVFVDLKLHDIPTTVARAAKVLGGLGVAYATVHAMGGRAMLEAAVEGMAAGAAAVGLPPPAVVAVTELTSEPAEQHVVRERVELAARSGCGGVVVAAAEVALVREVAPGLAAVVPGVRPMGSALDDQVRVATPEAAIAAGADLLVVGRAVTRAADPRAAAARVASEVREALRSTSPGPAGPTGAARRPGARLVPGD